MIDNEKFLQKRFDDIKSDISYKMNLCIYKCIRNGCTPYLLYLMIYDDLTKTYLLPNYTNILLDNQTPTSNSLIDESIGESVDSIEENIMNFFKEKLFDIYPPNTNKINYDDFEDSTDIYNEELFKGFFLHENEITMVYDATHINVPLESNNYCWVSPYEIFVSKRVKSIPISDSVEKIFDEISLSGSQNNVDFYHLKDVISNTIIKTPYILFMCKQVESSKSGFMLFDLFNTKKVEYSTVEYESDNENESIIFPTIQHPKLGNYTFFSSLPLKTSNLVKRFAVFVDIDELNPLYLEPSENDRLLTIYDFDKDIEQYTSVTFIEESIQFWCIKSSLYFSEIPDLLNNINGENEPLKKENLENEPEEKEFSEDKNKNNLQNLQQNESYKEYDNSETLENNNKENIYNSKEEFAKNENLEKENLKNGENYPLQKRNLENEPIEKEFFEDKNKNNLQNLQQNESYKEYENSKTLENNNKENIYNSKEEFSKKKNLEKENLENRENGQNDPFKKEKS
jgi:hypothetical protein